MKKFICVSLVIIALFNFSACFIVGVVEPEIVIDTEVAQNDTLNLGITYSQFVEAFSPSADIFDDYSYSDLNLTAPEWDGVSTLFRGDVLEDVFYLTFMVEPDTGELNSIGFASSNYDLSETGFMARFMVRFGLRRYILAAVDNTLSSDEINDILLTVTHFPVVRNNVMYEQIFVPDMILFFIAATDEPDTDMDAALEYMHETLNVDAFTSIFE